MNFTRRIIKFLLVAAIALPAWHASVAQNRAVPPEAEVKSGVVRAEQAETPAQQLVELPAPEPQPNTVKPIARMASRIGNSAPTLKAPMRADAVTVTPPSSAVYEVWEISTTWTYGASSGWTQADYNSTTVQVAFDGNDVYVSGLCYWLPSAWVKGTMNTDQTQVTFPSNQYYGKDGEDELWFVGLNSSNEVIDVVFAYDKNNHKLTLSSGTIIFDASEANSTEGYDYHTGTVISKPAETVTVADGTDTGKVPISPYYLDYYDHGQVIYPADSLNLTQGSKIKSITFYSNKALSSTSGTKDNTITVKIGETDNTDYGTTTAFISSNLTTVATLTSTQLLNENTSITISFNEPYEYQGGNLVIDASCPRLSSGKYASNDVLWYGRTKNGSSLWYGSSSSSTTGTQQNFLPKMTMAVEMAPAGVTTELDFGTVNVGLDMTLNAYVANESDSPVTATVTVSPNPTFSVASSTVTLGASGTTPIAVTFHPTNATNYTGTLTVTMGDDVKNIPLKGVGNMSGPEALRDSAFFADITYNWTDSQGTTHTSRLDQVATDPDQIIAMMREIYMNQDIPGNFTRGHTSSGNAESYTVDYSGVGTISRSTSGVYQYADDYGWNIPNKTSLKSTTYGDYTFTYLPPTDYQPKAEGVTLLLVEMADDFDAVNYEFPTGLEPDENLRSIFASIIKSVRVVTEAKRTGTGDDKGTLFKIDCDKMNKFFLLAKGQLRWYLNSYWAKNSDGYALGNTGCQYPCYVYGRYDYDYDGWSDGSYYLFSHMFEQFSPVSLQSAAPSTDLYQGLVNMESFNVQHDCLVVPFAYSSTESASERHGHQFMMYGLDSDAGDCQDVRDMMFFVPDKRMMYWSGRDNSNYPNYQKFLNYHTSHMPKMGLYVIRQDEITPTTQADDYYMLQLNWRTNLDDFLPSDQQEFELLQLVYDEETGQTQYVPVYYMNAQGQYTDANGNVVDEANKVPIILMMEAGRVKNYPNVYVKREKSSQEVTYAIRGRDAADADGNHFFSLQISNQMSYIIPGTDPNEMIALKDATHYSRFNPQTVRNCYSNKLQLTNSAMGINNTNITDGENGTKLFVTRSYMTRVNNLPVSVTDTVATITFNNHNSSNRSITVTMAKQSPKSEYPNGKSSGEGAGYHANTGETSWTQTYKVSTNSSNRGNIIFDALTIFDNFTVDVSNNDHPIGYTYEVKTNYAGQNDATVYSNMFRVPVYKTASLINGSFTKEEVDNDDDIGLSLADNVEFGTQVQYSSKTEILRYDAYRWNETEKRFIVDKVVDENGAEQDLPPTGIAGNQGDSYTVSMNEVGTDDYTTSTVSVGNGQTAWANFVDPMPKQNGANAYVYAPVVELFTTGKDENNKTRTDYNTYGGPLQNTAFSNLDVSVVTPSQQTPLMSNKSWTDEQTGNKYAWYQIFLNVDTAQVPQGYSLYGIRAWRHVPQNLLGEHPLFPRPERVPTNDEDIMFEKILEGYDHDSYQVLGSHAADYEDVQNGEVRATFGARKLRTEGGEETGVIDQLNAEFTVRLYFTPAPIYVYANPGGNDIDCNNAVATLYSDDGKTYTGTVTIPDKGDGTGYFVFSKKVGSSWSSNNQNIFGAQWNDAVALVGPQGSNNIWDFNLRYWSGNTRSFKITPGTYKFEITNHIQSRDLSSTADWSAGNLKITPVTANAGLRDGAAGATGKFYVAEQELNFSIDSSSDIITGIFDIDGAKQVAGVKYYNVAGIESDKPFDGINIVVTRYSDGSVVTRKEVK